MKWILIALAVLALLTPLALASTTKYQAEPLEELTPLEAVAEEEELTIPEMIDKYADMYGVSRNLAHYIAKNESSYNPNAIGDLYITCKATSSPHYGEAVYARGVYQITRCYHYNLTDAEAFDAETNIEYAMKLIAKGEERCKQEFTTCRNYYNNYE